MTEETKLLELDLSVASEEVLGILMDDASEPDIFREIFTSNRNRPKVMELLTENPHVPDEIREEARRVLSLPVDREGMHALKKRPLPTEEERKTSLLMRVQKLTVGEKVALALKGGRDIRTILCKDSNKEVVLSVLKNPKVTQTEAELIAHSRNIPEDALRFIAKNREWMKNYGVILALVTNPKTPGGVSSTLVSHLKTKDLVTLEKNKNVSDAVRMAAKKLLHARKPH
ncbi:MAG TPA: hypothetical protein VEI96_00545 [Thermodesulfovibrionales bacterium]|nr:hypothetical protein [Thermodesulfovibrionales bacterium]